MKRGKNIRERLWKETSGHCVYCGHPVSPEEMEVDHIVPKSEGGTGEYWNKVCSCPHCNADKADQWLDDYLAQFGEKKRRRYKNRLDTLVKQGKMSEEKAGLLYPAEDEFEKEGLTEWQALRLLADILIGRLSAIHYDYGRQEEKQYFGYY